MKFLELIAWINAARNIFSSILRNHYPTTAKSIPKMNKSDRRQKKNHLAFFLKCICPWMDKKRKRKNRQLSETYIDFKFYWNLLNKNLIHKFKLDSRCTTKDKIFFRNANIFPFMALNNLKTSNYTNLIIYHL